MFKKAKLDSFFSHSYYMRPFYNLLLLTREKSAVTASMMRVIQLRDGSDDWSNRVERSLIVAMYQVFLCLPAQHRKVFW